MDNREFQRRKAAAASRTAQANDDYEALLALETMLLNVQRIIGPTKSLIDSAAACGELDGLHDAITDALHDYMQPAFMALADECDRADARSIQAAE